MGPKGVLRGWLGWLRLLVKRSSERKIFGNFWKAKYLCNFATPLTAGDVSTRVILSDAHLYSSR